MHGCLKLSVLLFERSRKSKQRVWSLAILSWNCQTMVITRTTLNATLGSLRKTKASQRVPR